MLANRLTPAAFFAVFAFITLLPSQAVAAESGWAEDRVQVDLGLDEDGKTAPEAFVPFNWGDGWSSGIGFRSRQSDSNETIPGFTDSRVGTSVSEDRLRLNLIALEKGSESTKWSVGADFEQVTIDQLQFGYFQMPNPYVPNPAVAGEYVAFDSQVDVVITKPNVFADFTRIGKSINFRAGLSISPASSLAVDQETRFIPLIPTAGTRSSTNSQDLSYDLSLELEYKTGGSVNIGFGYYYELLPMQYDIAALNATADGFNNQTVDIEQATSRMALRFIFNEPVSGNLKPVVGIVLEDVEVTDVANNKTETETKNIITFGLESRF
ncbi:MAG: hypothetical protein OEY29_07270 [Gammaproteobacteria bacterium]|nr:hypothetical protein [Gammaproteobacteria bacterium]